MKKRYENAVEVSGGLGRVVSMLPSLSIKGDLAITQGWEELFYHTDLNAIEGGSLYIEKALENKDVVRPEPYHMAAYRKGEKNLPECFAEALGIKGYDYQMHKRNNPIKIPAAVEEWKNSMLRDLGVAEGTPVMIIDSGASTEVRKLDRDTVINAATAARNLGYHPIHIGEIDVFFSDEEHLSWIAGTSIIEYITLLSSADLFVGGDSAGLHISALYGVPSIIKTTSTSGIKYYPNVFKFVHPLHQNSVENCRLYGAEQRKTAENLANKCNFYTICAENIEKLINFYKENGSFPESL